MANTTNMIRLMTHAADLLDACDPMTNTSKVVAQISHPDARIAAVKRATAEVAAIAHASAILRMVAAAMDDEPETPYVATPLPGARVCAGRDLAMEIDPEATGG